QNLSDFFAFSFRGNCNVPVFNCFESFAVVMFGFGAQKVTCGHREPISQQVSETHYENYPGRELGTSDTTDHGEGRNGPVNTTVDPIAQIVMPRSLRKPLVNSCCGVFVLHLNSRKS